MRATLLCFALIVFCYAEQFAHLEDLVNRYDPYTGRIEDPKHLKFAVTGKQYEGYIIPKEANLRKGPGVSYPIVGALQQFTKVKVLGHVLFEEKGTEANYQWLKLGPERFILKQYVFRPKSETIKQEVDTGKDEQFNPEVQNKTILINGDLEAAKKDKEDDLKKAKERAKEEEIAQAQALANIDTDDDDDDTPSQGLNAEKVDKNVFVNEQQTNAGMSTEAPVNPAEPATSNQAQEGQPAPQEDAQQAPEQAQGEQQQQQQQPGQEQEQPGQEQLQPEAADPEPED